MMKSFKILMLFIVTCTFNMNAQDISFTAEVSQSELLMGNRIRLSIKVENIKSPKYTPPPLNEFHIVSGPNYSSSFSIINGASSNTASYTYILEPKDVGNYFIEAAILEHDGDVLETTPIEIIVAPNPDEIIQEIPQDENSIWNFDRRSPFEEKTPKKAPKKSKSKRKVYRI